MKFDFSPGDDCRVRIIPTLPDYPIARLEGRNGIGKTMAIRLLQLCTGDQPYHRFDKTVWAELKDALGKVSVTCSELQGAKKIQWEIDASLWPDEPRPHIPLLAGEGNNAICRAVTIDGNEADLLSVQNLLRVYRLAGDETLAQAIEADVVSRRSVADSERSEVDRRSAEVLTFLHTFSDQLIAASPATLEAATKELEAAKATLVEASGKLKEAESRHNDLKSLARQKHELSALVDEHGDPEAYVRTLEKKLEDLRVEQETLRSERDSLKLDVGRDAPALEEIKTLEDKLAEKREQRDEFLVGAQELAADLDLLSIPSSPKEPPFKRPLEEAEAELVELLDVQANLDAGPQIAALGERVVEVLAGEDAGPVRERPIATVDSNRYLSPSELEAGIKARQKEISEESRPPLAEKLENQIRVAKERLDTFEALAHIIRKVQRRDSDLKKIRAKLKELTDGLSGVEGERFAALENQQQDLAQAQSQCEKQLYHVRQQMHQLAAGASAGTIMERFERRVAKAKTSLTTLDTDIEEQARNVTASMQVKEEAVSDHETAEAGMEAAEAAQREAMAQMATSEHWERLREAGLLPEPSLDRKSNQKRIDHLLERCHKAEDALDAISKLASERVVAGIVAAERQEKPQSEGARVVLGLLEKDLGNLYFGHPSVAEALFDGGHLIRFDLIRQVVEWQPDAAERVARHLDAFSSGERAFAYTKTRLEKLREEPSTRNRFVALDEFGAFLERSRLELLEDYLSNDVIGKFVDQALIVLPISKARTDESAAFVTQPYLS